MDLKEEHSAELAADTDRGLLRWLNVVSPGGRLTNAGVIAFVGRGDPCLDYVRRAQAGGDSLSRIRSPDRSLIEELVEVFQAVEAVNRGYTTSSTTACRNRPGRRSSPTVPDHGPRPWSSPGSRGF